MPKKNLPPGNNDIHVKTHPDRTVMLCKACGHEEEVRLPLPVNQFCDILDGFQRRHVACRKVPR